MGVRERNASCAWHGAVEAVGEGRWGEVIAVGDRAARMALCWWEDLLPVPRCGS